MKSNVHNSDRSPFIASKSGILKSSSQLPTLRIEKNAKESSIIDHWCILYFSYLEGQDNSQSYSNILIP